MKTALILLIAATMLLFGAFFFLGCDEDSSSPVGPEGKNLILVANQNSSCSRFEVLLEHRTTDHVLV